MSNTTRLSLHQKTVLFCPQTALFRPKIDKKPLVPTLSSLLGTQIIVTKFHPFPPFGEYFLPKQHLRKAKSEVGLLHVFLIEGLGDEAVELTTAVELHAGELLADAAHLLAYDDVGVGLGDGSCRVTEGVLGRC